MNKLKLSIIVILVFFTLFSFTSCGKASHVKKILRDDASTASMMWLKLIEENGVNFEWDGSTLLGEAIKVGRVDLVEALIKDKVDVNRPALYTSLYGMNIGIPPLLLAGATSASDRILLKTNISPEESSIMRVMLIKAGAQVRTDFFDIILVALRELDEGTFDAALPKYDSKMLDYSFCSFDDFKAGRTPFSVVYEDTGEKFKKHISLLQKLMKKEVSFCFYDIQNAITMYLNPGLPTYGDEFLLSVLAYMANQKTIHSISEKPSNFNENNPQYINPLDIAVKSIYGFTSGNNIVSTSPELYARVVSLFRKAGLSATPYEWRIIANDSSSGSLSLFMHIISQQIQQEIKRRNPNGYNYSDQELNAKVYGEWTPDAIIDTFEFLSSNDALYFSKTDKEKYYNLDDSYLPDYLYRITIGDSNLRGENYHLPFNDLFEPYYSVFEWLATNGFLSFGAKAYLTFENGLSVKDFFSSYGRRLENKNTTPNDPNARNAISIAMVEEISKRDPIFAEMVLEEAREIVEGTRIGFSRYANDFLRDRFGTTNLTY